MIQIFLQHFTAFLKDLEESKRDGTWVVPPRCEPLRLASLIAMKDIIRVCESYFVSRDKCILHQGLITAGMDFCARWERWIDTLRIGDLQSGTSKVFHEYLLRFAKGMLKAYRIWRIDLAK